jgi:hypothetical protein
MADVLIATPVHGGQVTTHYAESLARLMVEAAKEGVKVRHAFIDSALAGWARAVAGDPTTSFFLRNSEPGDRAGRSIPPRSC